MDKQNFIEILKDALEMSNNAEVNFEDNFRDYNEWDSLARLSLIALLDQEYSVEIESEVFDKLNTVKELFDFIKSQK